MTVEHPTPTSEWFTLDERATTRIKWGDKNVTLHRSPTGRSFRIFANGKEWKPA